MQSVTEIPELLKKEKMSAALCTVISTKGSTPRKIGAKMLVFENGKIYGTIGGGNLEKQVIENAILSIQTKTTKLHKFELLQQLGMCCGGTVEIFIEPVMEKSKLYIFGAGHVGTALAHFASKTGFEVTVIDDRKEYISNLVNDSVTCVFSPFESAIEKLLFDNQTYIVVVTYSHPSDRTILSACINKPNAYLGMIGSRRKIEVTKKKFLENKIATKTQLENVDMPIGLDINPDTPSEIAVSILAKLISVKNGAKVRKTSKNDIKNEAFCFDAECS
ncbi:MAG: xanthine dehydrogenase accessory protein XdhC [Bacteroidetes bacterium]|nr:xanthine dehydrogenase accessory protein XdhC [Bacteroidota bacterium]